MKIKAILKSGTLPAAIFFFLWGTIHTVWLIYDSSDGVIYMGWIHGYISLQDEYNSYWTHIYFQIIHIFTTFLFGFAMLLGRYNLKKSINRNFKKCKYCGQTIDEMATVCLFCGEAAKK